MSEDHLVIFDFDGVIVNTLEAAFDLHTELFGPMPREDYLDHYNGNILDSIKARQKIEDRDAPAAQEKYTEGFTKRLETHTPEEKMPTVIQALSKQYPLVIVSSGSAKLIGTFLESHGLADCFQAIMGHELHGSKVVKIRMALQQHTIEANNAIMITDTLGDIREADQCNVAAIGVAWGYHPIETLQKGNPHTIVMDPDELIPAVEQYFARLEK